MKQERYVRAAIILVATAITCFVLVGVYAARPIEITYVTVEAASEATQREASAPTAAASVPEKSSRVEKPVLVEKSININTAGEKELDQLPGIGPALAQRIVTYREENNGFLDLEELMYVEGIGEKIFSKLEPYITVD